MNQTSRIRVGIILPLLAATMALVPLVSSAYASAPIDEEGLTEIELLIVTESMPGGSLYAPWPGEFMEAHGRLPSDIDKMGRIWSTRFSATEGHNPNDGEWARFSRSGAFNEMFPEETDDEVD